MAAWDTNSQVTLVSKQDAITKIKAMATAQGFTGGFKVLYDGDEITSPNELPAEVDMALVKVANKLNNA